MGDMLALILACVAGMALGVMFFAGLWWTLRRGLVSQRPVRWFVGSLLLRTGVALSGFYLVSQGSWQRLLSCLVGFVIARVGVTWLTHSPDSTREVRHAP